MTTQNLHNSPGEVVFPAVNSAPAPIIAPATIMFLIRSRVDYVKGRLQSKFVFNNPNEKGRFRCGESFYV
jgi:Fe-S cluster assembly iron-binding protein IscA